MTIITEHNIGDKVWDTLIGDWAIIVGISWIIGRKGLNDPCDNIGSFGYWLNNDYVSSGRHEWEIISKKEFLNATNNSSKNIV